MRSLGRTWASTALGAILLWTACLEPPPATAVPAEEAAESSRQAAPADEAPTNNILKLLTSDWRPYTGDTGKPRIALALIEVALRRIGYEPVFEVHEVFADAEAKMREPGYDGSPALWQNEERQAYLAYSEPYLQNRLVLVGRAGTDVSATELSQLAGKRIGIVRQYAYGDDVQDGRGPVLVRENRTADNLRSLLEGKVDYVLVDELLIRNLIQSQPEAAAEKIAVGDHTLVSRTLHLAIRKDRPDAQEILEKFNEVLRSLVADGTYHDILGVQWIRADVDGDGVEEVSLGGLAAGEEPPEWIYPLVEKEGTSGKKPQKRVEFFVDGTLYEDWSDIPLRYKIPPKPEPAGQYPGTDTVSLIEFKF